MSESDDVKRCVDQAVEMLHQRNLSLENENSELLLKNLEARESIRFHKQQAEFWAGECIAEEKKAHTSHLFMFLVSWVAFVAIGLAVSSL